jgi:hypothetical protein
MDADWISPFWQAFSQPSHVSVCGMSLPPLSVWHVFALENIGNTYIMGGLLDAGDAHQLLFVASRNRTGFLSVFHDSRRRKKALAIVRRRMLRYAWLNPKADCVDDCRQYVEQSLRVPGRWVKGGAKPCAVPNPLHILAGAVKMGIAYDAAWDMSYAAARCLFDTMAEQEGDDSVQTATSQMYDEMMAKESGVV